MLFFRIRLSEHPVLYLSKEFKTALTYIIYISISRFTTSLMFFFVKDTSLIKYSEFFIRFSLFFLIFSDNSCTEELSCHDSVAEMPSLVEYSATQAVVDQVIEVDSLITKLLKVLRLIQLDNDNCIQQLIVDK